MADEIIIETTSQEVIEVGVPGPQGATGPQGPAGAAGASAWNDITGKPATFAPSAHASSHHTGGSDPLAPANIGAAKAVTVIQLASDETNTITTADLPALGIATSEIDAQTFVINLPTPSAQQSGLTFSIKRVEGVQEATETFFTVNHASVAVLNGHELESAEGSLDFLWDGHAWSYSGRYNLRSFPGRVLTLPIASGVLALTKSRDDVFGIVGSIDATKEVRFEVDGLTTATTRTLTVPNASGTIALTSNFAAPPAIGITTPNTVAATDLSASNKLSLPSAAAASPTAGDLYRNANTLRYRDSTNTERLLLNATDNLSNLANTATARANLGLGGWATLSDGAALGTENLVISDGESPDFIQFTAGTGVVFNGNRAAQFRGALGLGTSNNVTFGSIQNTPIGSTTPAAGSFTTLSANNGTITASAPVLDLSQTWNNSGVTFTGLRVNVTNTASQVVSYYQEWQEGGVTQAAIRTGGFLYLRSGRLASPVGGGWAESAVFLYNGQSKINSTSLLIGSAGTGAGSAGVTLSTEGGVEHVLALRNAANPQTFRLYTTYGPTASDYERLFIKGNTGGAFQIGTEKGGTGGTRTLDLLVNGSVGMTVREDGITLAGGGIFWFFGRIYIRSEADGVLRFTNWAQNGFNRLQFGGTDANFPALKRSSTALQVRLADDSAFAPLSCGALTLNGNLDASARDIVTDTTTGTKIGTGTTQKIGFFNATPVVQQAAIADATDAATTQARLNDLLATMRTFGLIAT